MRRVVRRRNRTDESVGVSRIRTVPPGERSQRYGPFPVPDRNTGSSGATLNTSPSSTVRKRQSKLRLPATLTESIRMAACGDLVPAPEVMSVGPPLVGGGTGVRYGFDQDN